jgi:hypothetical protein
MRVLAAEAARETRVCSTQLHQPVVPDVGEPNGDRNI